MKANLTAPAIGATPYSRGLDGILERMRGGDVDGGMGELFRSLKSWRANAAGDWEDVIERQCLAHPVADAIFQDPMAFHSYTRPRGYPGDAELLDYIYGLKASEVATNASPLGRAVHEFLYDAPAARAVRARREVLARLVDETAARVKNARVLSIAAGHLREAALSSAVREGRLGEYVALDQDERSLEEIEASYGSLGVRTVPGSVRDLLAGRVEFAGFDLVYAAGLYDYLQQRTARRLTRIMFDALRPGGRLLVANFLPDIGDVGFMESYMSWQLIYRSRPELLDVAEEIPIASHDRLRLYTERSRSILFLDVERNEERRANDACEGDL